MTPAPRSIDDIGARYAETLTRYLGDTSEALLAEAYALGRRALADGLGLMDWATIHDDALAALDSAQASRETWQKAAAFFRESLAPFEMTQRGYAETNVWLERLNRDLINEIAEKEKLAAQLEESNNELEAFSYSVAHDLRAPVRAISGFSQMLLGEEGTVLPGDARDFLRRIGAAALRMSEMIEGLLALAHVRQAELLCQPVDLAARARAVVDNLRQLEPGRAVDVVIAEPLLAEGDPRLLDVVLQNLIGNAWKFTGKVARARIEVGADAAQSPPAYFVRDNGAGFDAQKARRLFGAFQRFHSQAAFAGTGIGLATVQRIVRRHGGRVWAESAVDQGATFFFNLKKS
ncbi:MAG TPA: ATP-binding protein [Polyangia bacterium]|nr:ATP-binding protein [Polyangia bacterium]